MSIQDSSFERLTVERIAQEYRDKGYQVLVYPDVTERPDFLREYQPDIIASSPKGSIVIEVKGWTTDDERARLQRLARRVESRPHWKFVVVSTGAGDSLTTPSALKELQRQEIVQLLDSVAGLSSLGHHQASILVAWSALESAMRIAAVANGLVLRRTEPLEVMRELVSNGVLERQQYRDISEALRVRNAIAHGFQIPGNVNVEQIALLLSKAARDLLADSHPDSIRS